jgi:hypothetical protein
MSTRATDPIEMISEFKAIQERDTALTWRAVGKFVCRLWALLNFLE